MRWREPIRRGEEAVEWMDEGRGSAAEVAQAYRQLEHVNRWLGGFRATFGPLGRLLPGHDITVLDVAGGEGAFSPGFRRLAAARGHRARVVVLDLHPAAVALAAAGGPEVLAVRGDALALPFGDRSLDVVHCSAFFHHLSTAHAREALGEMCRVSRRLVVVNDLVRSYVAFGAILVLTRLLSDNALIRHDGPLSVLKAFVPRELRALARAVTVPPPEYRWRLVRTFPYRMTLVGARR